jgi:hypothetical protein
MDPINTEEGKMNHNIKLEGISRTAGADTLYVVRY